MFGSCQPGDVRVRFVGVSLVANQSSSLPGESPSPQKKWLQPLILSENSSPLSLISLGRHSPHDLFRQAMGRSWGSLMLFRFVWSGLIFAILCVMFSEMHWLISLGVSLSLWVITPLLVHTFFDQCPLKNAMHALYLSTDSVFWRQIQCLLALDCLFLICLFDVNTLSRFSRWIEHTLGLADIKRE